MSEHEQAGGDEVEGEEDAGGDDGVQRLKRHHESRHHAHGAAHLIGQASNGKEQQEQLSICLWLNMQDNKREPNERPTF